MAVLQFDGDRQFPQAPLEVWSRLSDARFLVRCLPDVQGLTENEPARAVLKIRPGFSFVRGTLDVTLIVVEAVEAVSVRYQIHSKAIGSSSTLAAQVTLAANGTGTQLRWQAEVVELGGLLKAVPHGLLKAAAQKVIAEAWTRVDAQLASQG